MHYVASVIHFQIILIIFEATYSDDTKIRNQILALKRIKHEPTMPITNIGEPFSWLAINFSFIYSLIRI